MEELQRVVAGEQDRVQEAVTEAVREAVAAKLKAAVPSEEQTKALRYASFRQGMIMGEANAKADSTRQCQELLMSAVSQLHKAAKDAFAAEFSGVMHSTCALPRSASPSRAPDAGSSCGLHAGKHEHGEEDADVVARVLAQATASGTALSRSASCQLSRTSIHCVVTQAPDTLVTDRELLAVARDICESKATVATTVASERREDEDEGPFGEDRLVGDMVGHVDVGDVEARVPSSGGVFLGRICPVCAQRALLEFEERGVETEPPEETVERGMATSAVDLTCQGSTSILQSTKVKVTSDGTTRVSSNTDSAHACASPGTASSVCAVSVQTLISGEDQPYYRRRLADGEEEWIRYRRFRRQVLFGDLLYPRRVVFPNNLSAFDMMALSIMYGRAGFQRHVLKLRRQVRAVSTSRAHRTMMKQKRVIALVQQVTPREDRGLRVIKISCRSRTMIL